MKSMLAFLAYESTGVHVSGYAIVLDAEWDPVSRC